MTTWEWRMGRLVDAQTDDDVLVLADWFDVDQQDASLIAAAPEILAALKYCLSEGVFRNPKVERIALAAIAKAGAA